MEKINQVLWWKVSGRERVIEIGWSGRSPCSLNVKKKPAIQRSRANVLDRGSASAKGSMETELGALENQK